MLMIAGLIPQSSGTIAIGGQNVNGPYTDLGIVFQEPVLLDWRKVMGNVLLQVELRAGSTSASTSSARPSCSSSSGCRGSRTGTRTSSRAACASASRSAGRCCTTRRCC